MQLAIVAAIDPTTDYLKSLAGIDPSPPICRADHQTKARGSNLPKWHSPLGQNLYSSYAHPLNKNVSELAGSSIVIGLATINALINLLYRTNLSLNGLTNL
jgi:BirA family biotin operon repressor/biotin-[acetyl-CoA-carboxylase] ligase